MLTTRLGWITVAVGCLLLAVAMYHTRLWFGIPLEGGPMPEGGRLRLIGWVTVVVLLVPFGFYLGMVAVYGAFGLLMFVARRFSWQEAMGFGCCARYPRRWYRECA